MGAWHRRSCSSLAILNVVLLSGNILLTLTKVDTHTAGFHDTKMSPSRNMGLANSFGQKTLIASSKVFAEGRILQGDDAGTDAPSCASPCILPTDCSGEPNGGGDGETNEDANGDTGDVGGDGDEGGGDEVALPDIEASDGDPTPGLMVLAGVLGGSFTIGFCLCWFLGGWKRAFSKACGCAG